MSLFACIMEVQIVTCVCFIVMLQFNRSIQWSTYLPTYQLTYLSAAVLLRVWHQEIKEWILWNYSET